MVIALKNLKSEFFFEFLDLSADDGLRDMQALSGLAEMQGAGHRKHVLKLLKRGENAYGNRLRETRALTFVDTSATKTVALSFFDFCRLACIIRESV